MQQLSSNCVLVSIWLKSKSNQRFSKPPPTRAILTDEMNLRDADMLCMVICDTVCVQALE
jgi:hypothetical protein